MLPGAHCGEPTPSGRHGRQIGHNALDRRRSLVDLTLLNGLALLVAYSGGLPTAGARWLGYRPSAPHARRAAGVAPHRSPLRPPRWGAPPPPLSRRMSPGRNPEPRDALPPP